MGQQRLQFSLKTTVILVLGASICFGWFADRRNLIAQLTSTEERLGETEKKLSFFENDSFVRMKAVSNMRLESSKETIKTLLLTLSDPDPVIRRTSLDRLKSVIDQEIAEREQE